ncbi:embryo-specific protein ATS3A-like [Argentina anserina]|uniref:embryo-specific protein ATS3A-like n=1 Tax=Argentina anserina TaxID=57926 RepID=UPI00217686A0|nr:embryo-specific protein ATS3A-like [Potentilla anserina]
MATQNCGGLFLTCCVLLLALFAGGESFAPKNKENCTYAVTIETTCTKGASTSSNISLRFGDTNSNDVLVKHLNSKHIRKVDPVDPQVLDDVPKKPFHACVVDQFQVMGQCVDSPICYLYLKLAGIDDWRPGFAQVHVLEGSHSHLSSDYFYFRRYLPRRAWHGLDMCDKEATPFGIKHKRKLFAKKKNMSLHAMNTELLINF